MTFSKEQLIARARFLIQRHENSLASQSDQGGVSMDLELARMALAGMEAEPVAYVDPHAFQNFSVYRAGETDNKRMGRDWMWANPDAGLIPVYTLPAAPQQEAE